jgi:hypothetical protein
MRARRFGEVQQQRRCEERGGSAQQLDQGEDPRQLR